MSLRGPVPGEPEYAPWSSPETAPTPLNDHQGSRPPSLLLPLLRHARMHAWPGHADGPKSAIAQYLPLHQVLSCPFATDAHTTQYSAPSRPRRLDAGAPESLRGGVPMVVRILDIDDPVAHAETARRRKLNPPQPPVPARPEWWAEERPKIAALLEAEPGAFGWESRGGYKILEVLRDPLVIRTEADAGSWRRAYFARIAHLLRVYGIECDPACGDWQHLFRVPRATRERTPEDRPTHGDVKSVTPWQHVPACDDADADLAAARALAESRAMSTPPGRPNLWAVVAAWLGTDESPAADAARCAAARVERAARLVAPRVVRRDELNAVGSSLGALLGCRPMGSGARHAILNALAGALCERGVAACDVEEIVQQVAAGAGEDPQGRVSEARSTLRAWGRGRPVSGLGWLRRHAPDVANALDETVWDVSASERVRAVLDARALPAPIDRDEAGRRIRHAVIDALTRPPGIVVVRATEGTGKTRHTEEAIVSAANDGARVALLAPDHTVAAATAERLRTRLGSAVVLHLRGILSVPGAFEGFACRKRPLGMAFARAGHAIVPTLCEGTNMADRNQGHRHLLVVGPTPRAPGNRPCEARDECDAFRAVRAGIGAEVRVVVSVHALAGRAVEWLRDEQRDPSLLVIDEGPSVLDAVALTSAALDAAAAADGYSRETTRWRNVVLRALAEGLRRVLVAAPPTGEELLAHLARLGIEALRGDAAWRADFDREYGATGDAQAMLAQFAVRAAYVRPDEERASSAEAGTEWRRRVQWAPRPSRAAFGTMLTHGSTPTLEQAGRVHADVARLAAGLLRSPPPGPHQPHAERAACYLGSDVDGSPVLLGQLVSTGIAEALAWGGPTVLLDATCDVSVLRAVVNGHPDAVTTRGDLAPEIPITCEEIRVVDGALVERHVLAWSDATRRACLSRAGGATTVRWAAGAAGALRAAMAHVERHRPRKHGRLGLITWRALALILRRAWEAPAAADADATAVALLQPWREAGIELVIGWYGATRGHNEWHERHDGSAAPCDALMLFGAPFGPKLAARSMAAALHVSEDWDGIYRRAAEAEASQAAGRARAPWRIDPLVIVAVMPLAPAGWTADARVYSLPRGPAVALSGAAVIEAVSALGSTKEAARFLGVDRRTVERRIVQASQDVAAWAGTPTETPPSSESLGRGIRPARKPLETMVNRAAGHEGGQGAEQDLTRPQSSSHGSGTDPHIDQQFQGVPLRASSLEGANAGHPIQRSPAPDEGRHALHRWLDLHGGDLAVTAATLGVSERTLRRYVGGQRTIPDEVLALLGQELDCEARESDQEVASGGGALAWQPAAATDPPSVEPRIRPGVVVCDRDPALSSSCPRGAA